jgi:tetratricopeptide (TPR) repeat protein
MLPPDPSPRVPLPPRRLFERLKLPGPVRPTAAALDGVRVNTNVLQDFRPLADSLEWELSDLYWAQEGVLPFAANEVPFLINNDGRASENAAAVLFANCAEAPPADRVGVLELGAGSGLFARYFLDAFRIICEQEGRDFYDRLVYLVSDRSRRTPEQWAERDQFAEHAGHVVLGNCDAQCPGEFRGRDGERVPVPPVRAVFANYVLDVLPSAVVRGGPAGPEMLCVRTHLTTHAGLLPQYSSLGLDEVRALAASEDPARRAQLLPVLSLLELETAFLPVGDPPPPYLQEALAFGEGLARVVHNYGAITCLEGCLRLLEPEGFVLLNDYGPVAREEVAGHAAVQRFGGSTALGINFPLLERYFAAGGRALLRPGDEEGQHIHARLLCRADLPRTREAFAFRCSGSALAFFKEPAEHALRHAAAGRSNEALEGFRAALTRCPRDWQVIGQAAQFVGLHLRDLPAGLELVQAALALNPWYSAWLWNVLGDILFYLNRHDDAHEAYLQARRIDPQDLLTNFNLSFSYFQRGDFGEALAAIARGLARDVDGSFRARLLDKQQQIMSAVSGRWLAEQERLRKRALAFL